MYDLLEIQFSVSTPGIFLIFVTLKNQNVDKLTLKMRNYYHYYFLFCT